MTGEVKLILSKSIIMGNDRKFLQGLILKRIFI